MAYDPTYYEGKRLEILKRIQRDKDQFVQDIVDMTARLLTSNQEDTKALKEIEDAVESANANLPTPDSTA